MSDTDSTAAPTLDLEQKSHQGDELFADARAREAEVRAETPAVEQALRPKPRKRRALAIVASLLIALLAIGIGVYSWINTDEGHQWIARQLEEVISGQIRGHLVVGHLDEIDLHHVVGTDIRFEDESGRPVIVADHVDMAYELSELTGGHFVSHSSHVDGGRVIIETDHDGVLLVNRAFMSAHPGASGAPVGADVVHLDHLQANDVSVVTSLGAAPTATLSHLGAMVMVRAPENGAALVDADHVHGHLNVAAPIPFDLNIVASSLLVDGAAHRRVHLDMPARMGSERIDIEVTALTQPDDSLHVDAYIRPHGLSAMIAATGMIAQCLLAETATSALDVTVEMQ